MSENKAESLKDKGILWFNALKEAYPKAIVNIAREVFYVYNDTKIGDLADAFIAYPLLPVVGTVSHDGRILGIIVREELFNQLGKPYGREVLKNRSVEFATRTALLFNYLENIYAVADTLSRDLKEETDNFYILEDEDHRFVSILSTKNLLIYLSGQTRRDLAHAREIQQNIVHQSMTFSNTLIEIEGVSNMVHDIGGDFYFIGKYSEKNWVVFICDVCGKGISASLVSSVIGGMAEIYDFSMGLSGFLHSVNSYMYRINEFVTGIFVDFDETTGNFSFSDMGHSFIFRFDGCLKKLEAVKKSPPLGILPDIKPVFSNGMLLKNEMLLLLTDGIFEQADDEDFFYPDSRLENLIADNYQLELEKLKEVIIKDIDRFRGHQPQYDDTTFILLKYRGNHSDI